MWIKVSVYLKRHGNKNGTRQQATNGRKSGIFKTYDCQKIDVQNAWTLKINKETINNPTENLEKHINRHFPKCSSTKSQSH